MAFISHEFPGRSFSSIEELNALQQVRDKLRKRLAEPVIVTVIKE